MVHKPNKAVRPAGVLCAARNTFQISRTALLGLAVMVTLSLAGQGAALAGGGKKNSPGIACEAPLELADALHIDFRDVTPEKDGEVLYIALDVQPAWDQLVDRDVESRVAAFVDTGKMLGTRYICNEEYFSDLTSVEIDYVSIFSADEYDTADPDSFRYYGSLLFRTSDEGLLVLEKNLLDMDALTAQ
ncbi:MAG: hypothetical protein RIE22_09400 [Alphaproteobacteria bacterium]